MLRPVSVISTSPNCFSVSRIILGAISGQRAGWPGSAVCTQLSDGALKQDWCIQTWLSLSLAASWTRGSCNSRFCISYQRDLMWLSHPRSYQAGSNICSCFHADLHILCVFSPRGTEVSARRLRQEEMSGREMYLQKNDDLDIYASLGSYSQVSCHSIVTTSTEEPIFVSTTFLARTIFCFHTDIFFAIKTESKASCSFNLLRVHWRAADSLQRCSLKSFPYIWIGHFCTSAYISVISINGTVAKISSADRPHVNPCNPRQPLWNT